MPVLALIAFVFSPSLLFAADAPQSEFNFSLFDGQSLSGWTAENGCEVGVTDGLLVLQGGNGWLRSDFTYADFVLHVEWKALQKSNYDAGIYIRTLAEGTPFPTTGYQVGICSKARKATSATFLARPATGS